MPAPAPRNDGRNLGRQDLLTSTAGTWPGGELLNVRAAYDELLTRQAGTKTKTCYNCHGSGKVGGKQCTACGGSGSVPSA